MPSDFDEIVPEHQAEQPFFMADGITDKPESLDEDLLATTDSVTLPINAKAGKQGLNETKRDRFELLSAYLDGEVTAAENRLVKQWLAEDPEIQGLYHRLLMLRQAMQKLPIQTKDTTPTPSLSSLVLKRANQRLPTISVAVACTLALLLVSSLVNLVGFNEATLKDIALKFNRISAPPSSSAADILELALDEPAIELEDQRGQ